MIFGFEHLAIVVSDMDQAFERLRALKVQFVSTGPQRLPDWNPTAAGIKEFYFRDPDQHTLEVIWFAPGKGDPRWQRRSDKPFLGIDHTAIAVSDSAASLHFMVSCWVCGKWARAKITAPSRSTSTKSLARACALARCGSPRDRGSSFWNTSRPGEPAAAGRRPGQRPASLANDACYP